MSNGEEQVDHARSVELVEQPASGGFTAVAATGIGSLPHIDPVAAARLVLDVTPALPAAPQLPNRTPLEQMVVQWIRALPEVRVEPDGTFSLRGGAGLGPVSATFDADAHGGLLAFVDLAAREIPPRVKVQCTGPLTLALALHAAGAPVDRALARGFDCAKGWALALRELFAARVPDTVPLIVFDEPGLVSWARRRAPVDRDTAIDTLSAVLSATPAATGVHVCGDGDISMAIDAGPTIVACERRDQVTLYASSLAGHLERGGTVAWGAVPTDRPVGESAEPLWRHLERTFHELEQRGCDPERLRTQALVTPACGLAGHGLSQAVHALRLAGAVADRLEGSGHRYG